MRPARSTLSATSKYIIQYCQLQSLCYTTEDEIAGWHHKTPWAWVWVNSRSLWWTGRPGVLQFMGSQRVGHDWATELNWMLYIGSPEFIIAGDLYSLTIISPCPSISSPWQPQFYFLFLTSVFLDSTYTWYHILFISIWLTSDSPVPSGLSQMAGSPSFLWLNIISWYILFISHFLYLFIHHWTFRMFTSCVFNAAVNMGLQISLQK